MPVSDDVIRRRCEMFESYCKTVLRNYARDLERAERRREGHEILTDDPLRYLDLFEQRAVETEIEIDEPYTIMCMGKPCVITEETLYKALLSLSEYRRIIWRCNGKYEKGEKPCSTPHFYEEQLKTMFTDMMNSQLTDREDIISAYKGVIQVLANNDALMTEITGLQNECDVILELMRQMVQENARAAGGSGGIYAAVWGAHEAV